MVSHPLSGRVVLLSWLVAASAWPVAWWMLAVAQGVGALAAGGGWIGVAVPLGGEPWALVNEPTVAFAATRGALFGYWLPPLLAAAILAVLLPLLASAPGTGWWGELFLLQLAFASAVLGLGLAPSLGLEDGPVAGLSRFWRVNPAAVVWLAAALGVLSIQVAGARLGRQAWAVQGGPRRWRRIAAFLVHAVAPAIAWLAVVVLRGWPLPMTALAPLGVVLAAGLVGAVAWTPRAPLRPRHEAGSQTLSVALAMGLFLSGFAAWAGGPANRQGKALLWGAERMTSNVRPGMERIPLRPLRPPAPSPRSGR